MLTLKRMHFYCLSSLIIISLFAHVTSLNVDSLKARYPIYGLSLLTNKNSSACFRELNEFKDAVEAEKVWGLKVLDSSGRPPVGFLYGNNLWIGSHTECTEIQNRKEFEIRTGKVNHTVTPFDYPPYELAFAMVMMSHNSTLQYHMRLPLDYVIQLGLCVPKSCSQNEILFLSEQYFSNNSMEFQKEYHVSIKVDNVRILEENGLWMLFLPKTIIFITITLVIFILTIFGTICDVKQHNREKNLISGHNNGIISAKFGSEGGISPTALSTQRFFGDKESSIWIESLKCFSIYSNIKRWSKSKISTDSLSMIHGLRFFAMGWVIIVHTSFFQGDFIRNPPYAWRLTENFMAQIFSNSTYCVDTYLFLSGFLLAYLFFKKVNPHDTSKEPKRYLTNIKKFLFMYMNRFLRLTPTYVIAILLCNLVYTYYSKKSSLYFSERPDLLCDKYWWRNILYINNLFPRSEMCLSWSWYLSIDMQFFAIGTTLLLLSTMYFQVAASLVILIILIQIITTTYKSYTIGYIPTLDDQLEQLDAIYDLPWNRIGPYMIGLIAAYILVIKLQNKLVLKEWIRLTLWIVFPLLNLWILFTLYTRQVSVEFSAFYMGVSRTLWGVGIAWFVLAVSTGNARLLEKFLSYGAWIPLGRLTFCAYLLNPLMVTMISLGAEEGITISIPEMGITANGIIMVTMLVSFLFSLLFESPFILLTKLLLKYALPKPIKNASLEKVTHTDSKNDSSNECSVTIE